MNFFDKFQRGLEKVVGPFATAVANSRYIKALTEGFMYTMPITLGVAAIAVLANLPIPAWTQFLQSIGIYATALEVVSLTLSLLAIYVVGAIGYAFTKNEGENGAIGAVMSMAAFIILIPVQTFTNKAGAAVSTIATSYLGSDGIFLAIILGLVIPAFYCFLMKKNLKLKLPDSVPPMVSQSLAPTFVAMILITSVFAVLSSCIQIGGAGNTLGLCIASFFGKSEKYKTMRKLVAPANLFNINEPAIFGFPIMLNPIYLIPMIFSAPVKGLLVLGLLKFIPVSFNPTISMPWVTPGFVTAFFQGGVPLLVIWFLSLGIDFLMYLPFFLIDDKNALRQEQENA